MKLDNKTPQTIKLIDTQSILSVVDKFPKIFYIEEKYCGRVDLYVYEWVLESTRPFYECL